MMRVRISNGVDSIEQMFKGKDEVIEFLQKDGVILKQALKALAEVVPVEVAMKQVETPQGQPQQVQTYNAPRQPFRSRGTEAEVCPQCQEKSFYVNTSKSPKNFGKRYKKCSACGNIDWWECVKGGSR